MTSTLLDWIRDLSWSDASLRGATATVLATLALIIALKLLASVFHRLRDLYRARIEASKPAVKFQLGEPVITSQIQRSVINSLRLFHFLAAVVLIDIYVTLVLRLYPATKAMSDQYFKFIMSPLAKLWKSILSYIPNAIEILVILAFTFVSLRILHIFFRALKVGAVKIPGFYKDWSEPTYKLLRAIVLMFLLVRIFPLLPGADEKAFKAVSIFIGALLSLGSTGAMKNAIAGVVLIYTRAFQIGDWIQIGQSTGEVVRRKLLETRLRTTNNEQITIPNNEVLKDHVINFTPAAKQGQLGLSTSVTIGYDVDWRTVNELLLKAAAVTPNLSSDPPPFVLNTGLDDFYVNYKLRVYTSGPPPLNRIHTVLRQNILDAFNSAGVEIMSPSFQVERSSDQPTIPKDQSLTKSGDPIQYSEPSND